MKHLIIFHYHFLPGGVTDVVISAVQAYLSNSGEIDKITIVSGRQDNMDKVREKIILSLSSDQKRRLEIIIIDEIDYQERLEKGVCSDSIKKRLTIDFSGDESVWWIHNYHLGKNPYFTKALLEIARDTSQKMVFHIHDFPECSRYELFHSLTSIIKGDIYSSEDNVRYAVINSRDFNNLKNAGIPDRRLFLLENPISLENLKKREEINVSSSLTKAFSRQFPGWKADEPYMIYPVRAIRRKNVAEAAFLAMISDKNVIVTLPGVSQREEGYSTRIKEIFESGLAPGLFGIGFDLDKADLFFPELIASCSAVLSTSVQEGFGYLFLNSLNWGKPLIARDLDVLESFKPVFAEHETFFYDRLNVPSSSLDIPALVQLYREKIGSLSTYLPDSLLEMLETEIDNQLNQISIDFSLLTLKMQIEVMKLLKEDSHFMNQCRRDNSIVVDHIKKSFITDCSHRKDILEKNWSYKIYSDKTDAILHSFSNTIPLAKHKRPSNFIYETTLQKFATIPYLRLIYDE
ncbi:hypothetical protein [Spirochaeta isovalerica]|uniref:Glycosyltransferase n=1 Tax=Spirochaeta isovalerica TaxID=150 RepID=A0A841R4P9_9SPIO|nr:hypothetical protein [Spirochaeta isovalerica]MBB6478371.1 hypothetical protein [Spirochaeta isovalerica]